MVGLDAEPTLRDLGMCGDITKAMHRAFTERGQDRGIADYVINGDTASPPIIGRLAAGAKPGREWTGGRNRFYPRGQFCRNFWISPQGIV
jgi:Protein of unknown function (DUF3363)